MNLPNTKIAVTLFPLNQFCKTESDLDRTLDKLCAIGFEAVQVSALSLEPAVIRRQLDKHNLYCCATHDSFANIVEGDSAALADKQDIYGCNYVALGAPPNEWKTPEKITELAKIFNAKGAELAARGIRLGYHNHHFEFEKHGDSRTLFEIFFAESDPKLVCSELDTHWVTRGGGCPAMWIEKLAGRIPVIHFKDFVMLDGEPRFCEIGEGNLDWQGILAACQKTRVRWYVIEQDQPIGDRCLFDSVKISFDNLKRLGVN